MDILHSLSEQDSQKYIELTIQYGTNLIGAIAVLVIGRLIAKFLVNKVLKNALSKSKADATLVSFLSNITYTALLTFVIISALGTLGINTTSFAAVIAAAGLAIGLALQGSLSNFAAGFMIIIFKWFKKGDWIEAAGVSGSVVEVSIFTTKLKTGDNKIVIIPNGQITSGVIINYSNEKTRRVDMVFGIGYDDDIKLTKKTLERILKNDDRVLKDPEPVIAVASLGDSSVNFNVRPWVKTEDYWNVLWDTHETVKLEFDKAGISIPFPQSDVHVYHNNDDSKISNGEKPSKNKKK